MRSWVRIRSESTVAFGQPSETNPTLGTFFDMTGRASVMQQEKMAREYTVIWLVERALIPAAVTESLMQHTEAAPHGLP